MRRNELDGICDPVLLRKIKQDATRKICFKFQNVVIFIVLVLIAAGAPFLLPHINIPLYQRGSVRFQILVGVLVCTYIFCRSLKVQIRSMVYTILAMRGLIQACRKCNYNLRGNRSGICPECGTPMSLEQFASVQ